MFIFIKHQKGKFLFAAAAKLTVFVLTFSLIFSPTASIAQSINLLNLPIPGTMIMPSPTFVPVLLKGMTIHPEDPLKFDFIIDSGNTDFTTDQVKEESEKLVKYFLASMTIPKDDLWVNLSPYEQDRIIPDELGKTELGRDMLAQDYILKQLTASLMYPEEELGKKFWDRVYKKAEEQFGTSEIPVNTFNKVWILPETATVYEHEQTVYVVDAHLKVMLDSDYEAAKQPSAVSHQLSDGKLTTDDRKLKADTQESSEQIIREIIIPEIEREVNEGEHFAPLRQIYHSLILAKWYKETVKNSLLSQVYVDKNLTAGVESTEKDIKDQIYAQYMEAYKKGVFNFIKEDYNALSQEMIPRKYFSGGEKLTDVPLRVTKSSSPIIGNGFDGQGYKARVAVIQQNGGVSSTTLSPEGEASQASVTSEDEKRGKVGASSPIANERIVSLQQEALAAKENGKKVVIFVASEGWSKKGGQGDVIRKLGAALAKAGHMLIVVNPYFEEKSTRYDISQDDGSELFDFKISLGEGEVPMAAFYNNIKGVHYVRYKIKDTQMQGLIYPEVYPEGKINGISHQDSLYGYIGAVLLSKAGMHITKELGIALDAMHFHDWQAGLGPVYMEETYRMHPDYKKFLETTGTVATTHNGAYKGEFQGIVQLPPNDPVLKILLEDGILKQDMVRVEGETAYVELYDPNRDYMAGGIPTQTLSNLSPSVLADPLDGIEYHSTVENPGQHGFSKGSILMSDIQAAVSSENMRELQLSKGGYGLEGAYARRAREGALTYSTNGIAEEERPDNREALTQRVGDYSFVQFSSNDSDEDLKRKRNQNRHTVFQLLKTMKESGGNIYGELDEKGLDTDFISVAVSRLVKQKGYTILFQEIDDKGTRLVDAIFSLRGNDGEKIRLFLMATPGDDDGVVLAGNLKKLSEEYPGQLVYAEIFNEDLAAQILSGFEAFFMPSAWEPGGISNKQAAAMGLVNILTRTGGLIDFVNQGGTSKEFAVEPFDYGDPDSMKRSAQAFAESFEYGFRMNLKNPEKFFQEQRKAMAFRGFWSDVVEDYVTIYDQAQAKHSTSSPLQTIEELQGALNKGNYMEAIEGLVAQQIAAGVADEFTVEGDYGAYYDDEYASEDRGKFRVLVNPRRHPDKRATLKLGKKKCFLCADNMPDEEDGLFLDSESDFMMFVNPGPYEKNHVVIVDMKNEVEHPFQALNKRKYVKLAIDAIYEIAAREGNTDFNISFNSVGAAASSRHFHFHGFEYHLPVVDFERVLIERTGVNVGFVKDYPGEVMVVEGKDRVKVVDEVYRIVDNLYMSKLGEGIAYNVLFKADTDGTVRAFIFARDKETPGENSDKVLIQTKFGAVEVGGSVILYDSAGKDGEKGEGLFEFKNKKGEKYKLPVTKEILENSIAASLMQDRNYLMNEILELTEKERFKIIFKFIIGAKGKTLLDKLLPGREKYDEKTKKPKRVGGVSIIDGIGLMNSDPRKKMSAKTRAFKDKFDGLLRDIKEELGARLLSKLAFVAEEGQNYPIHVTTYDLIYDGKKTELGERYDVIREKVKAEVLKFMTTYPKQSTRVKIDKLTIFGSTVAVLGLKFVEEDDKKMFLEFRRQLDKHLASVFKNEYQLFRDGIVASGSYNPHITLGYFVNPLTETQIEGLVKSWDRINKLIKDADVEFDLSFWDLTTFTSMDDFETQEVNSKKFQNGDSDYTSSPISAEEVGGIDMNEIEVERQGGGVDIQFDPIQIQEMIDMGIAGFAPVIINFVPLPSVLPLLGLEPRRDEEFELSSLN